MGRLTPINLGGGGGSGAITVDTVADLPLNGGSDGQLYFVLTTKKLYAWDVDSGLYNLIGGAGAQLGRNGSEALASAQQTVTVVFGLAMPSTSYRILANFTNTTDADPIFLQMVSVTKLTTGFTAVFNAPTDSANYVFEWIVVEDAPQDEAGSV